MLRTEWTTVGPLRALVHVPDQPVAALVLVDGSGESRCDDWGGWVERAGEDPGSVFEIQRTHADRTSQLAAGFLPMLGAFFRSVG